ncbi:hypothetical protein HPG69_019204, partial [Diceros bicornis minor]
MGRSGTSSGDCAPGHGRGPETEGTCQSQDPEASVRKRPTYRRPELHGKPFLGPLQVSWEGRPEIPSAEGPRRRETQAGKGGDHPDPEQAPRGGLGLPGSPRKERMCIHSLEKT